MIVLLLAFIALAILAPAAAALVFWVALALAVVGLVLMLVLGALGAVGEGIGALIPEGWEMSDRLAFWGGLAGLFVMIIGLGHLAHYIKTL